MSSDDKRKFSSRFSQSQVNCCVLACFTYATKNPELSFHSFPKDLKRRALWAEKLNINFEHYSQGGKFLKVCSRHFSEKDFMPSKEASQTKRRVLRKSAIPTKRPVDKPNTNNVKPNLSIDEPKKDTLSGQNFIIFDPKKMTNVIRNFFNVKPNSSTNEPKRKPHIAQDLTTFDQKRNPNVISNLSTDKSKRKIKVGQNISTAKPNWKINAGPRAGQNLFTYKSERKPTVKKYSSTRANCLKPFDSDAKIHNITTKSNDTYIPVSTSYTTDSKQIDVNDIPGFEEIDFKIKVEYEEDVNILNTDSTDTNIVETKVETMIKMENISDSDINNPEDITTDKNIIKTENISHFDSDNLQKEDNCKETNNSFNFVDVNKIKQSSQNVNCPHCLFFASDLESLIRHVYETHNQSSFTKKYYCALCKWFNINVTKYFEHLRQHPEDMSSFIKQYHPDDIYKYYVDKVVIGKPEPAAMPRLHWYNKRDSNRCQ